MDVCKKKKKVCLAQEAIKYLDVHKRSVIKLLSQQIGYEADRVQMNFLQLLSSDATQRVNATYLEHYHSSVMSSIQSEVSSLNNEKARQLERLNSRSLLFRGPGKELLGVNERRPVVIQSTCEVGLRIVTCIYIREVKSMPQCSSQVTAEAR